MARIAKFKMFVTSDIHGHLLPVDYADDTPSNDSLANVASIIKTFRTEHSVLLDLGDSIQGSPLMDFHQLHRTKFENPVASCLNLMKYDYFIPGNHDFNFGRKYLEDFIHSINAQTLCANILSSDGQYAFGKPYDILEIEPGLKIAIIGVTTQYIPNWERKETIRNLIFENACQVAKDLVEEVKTKHQVQLVIVAYHGGFEKDLTTFLPYIEDTGENLGSRMLESIPDMDILITGHQHRTICQKVRDTIVIQPMFNGRAVAMIDVEFAKTDKWKTNSMNASLIESKDYLPDDEICSMLEQIENSTGKYLDKVLGHVTNNDMEIEDKFQARLKKHKIVTLINQVQIEKTNAMISCCSLGNHVTGFAKEITIRNILSTYVFPNTLVVLEIDGNSLKKALEKNAEYFVIEQGEIVSNPKYSYPKKEHYNYDMFDGIDYTIDVAKPLGSRITSLKYNGLEILPTDMFTLAMNNYRATGGGEFTMYRNLKIVKEVQSDIATLLIEYIKKHKFISVKDTDNIMVINSSKS